MLNPQQKFLNVVGGRTGEDIKRIIPEITALGADGVVCGPVKDGNVPQAVLQQVICRGCPRYNH